MHARCRTAERGRRLLAAPALTLAMVAGLGCSQNIFKTGIMRPGTSPPPPGLAPPVIEGPPVVSMDGVPPILPATPAGPLAGTTAAPIGGPADTMLARSREQTSLLEEEVRALRDQLASTSTQLAAERQRATGVFPPTGGLATGTPPPQGAEPLVAAKPSAAPAAMQAAMVQLHLPEGQARVDGSVVRIEVPSDKLFEGSTAALLPGGAALLTQVAAEVTRVYPNHFLGIEGHLDSEPLPAGSQFPPHQLTAARAAAVFDFLTTRTSIPSRQLFLVAHGPNHPVVSNATAAGRARNRRIELVVYPETLAPSSGL